MMPADQNSTGSFAEEVPEATETQQCPRCDLPQLEEMWPEMPEEEVEQKETPEAVETQQCPNCNLLQLEEEPGPRLELYCECSKPVATDQGIPVGPEQVLAQYNSRPPILITNPRRPVSTAPAPITSPGRPVSNIPTQINPNSGRPVSAAPILIRPNPVQPVHVAPRSTSTCSRRPAYAAPILNNPKPGCPSCGASKRRCGGAGR